MSAFRALASSSDSSDDEREARQEEAAAAHVAIANGAQEVELADEDGDSTEWLPARRRPSVDDDVACFICSRGFSRKSRPVSIPCAASCNPDVHIHRPCLNQWRERKATCPLCRAELVEPQATQDAAINGVNGAGSEMEVDGLFGTIDNELDVKARRALPTRRLGKTNTFKVTLQRNYAKAKRDAQRQQAKAAMVAGWEDGDE